MRLEERADDAPAPKELVLAGRLTIGSAPDNDLVVRDAFVSAHHCVVRREGTEAAPRFAVVDRGSRNGTWIGGTRVAAGELSPGARLQVGRTGFRLLGEGPSSASAGAGLFGRSPQMARLRDEIARVAASPVTVLLQGESGTGKELAARALHDQSGRGGAFVAVNCGALSPSLVEDELFGHERGAFTGAAARRAGVFEEADRGTLFLDEIGELPLSVQPKLLRALEERAVRAVGSNQERRFDTRVVAATHRDLEAEVQRGTFRLDLYHRLSTVILRLPPLRERREDLALLCDHFLETLAPEVGQRALSPGALEALSRQRFAGNVRELKNLLHRAALLGGTVLEASDLLPSRAAEIADAPVQPVERTRLAEVERDTIAQALRRTPSRRAAALALGIPKSTLCDKVRRYGLDAAP